MRHAHISKYYVTRENHAILLKMTDGGKWYYLPVNNLSALFREITSSYVEDFYCLNFLNLVRTKNKLKEHENVYKNHD